MTNEEILEKFIKKMDMKKIHMKKWEYKTVHYSEMGGYFDFKLNAIGSEGWELCCCSSAGFYYIFKRELL